MSNAAPPKVRAFRIFDYDSCDTYIVFHEKASSAKWCAVIAVREAFDIPVRRAILRFTVTVARDWEFHPGSHRARHLYMERDLRMGGL